MPIPPILIFVFLYIVQTILSVQKSNFVTFPGCSAGIVSWRSCNKCIRNGSNSGMYSVPQYEFCPPCSIYSATVIPLRLLFVGMASSIFLGSRSISQASSKRLDERGLPCMGGMSDNKRYCCGRFCGFRNTCSIFFNLASPPLGRSPGLLVKGSAFPFHWRRQYTI